MSTSAQLDLYWIPLGAGARVVRASGWTYEAILAAMQRRGRQHLYHSALIATIDGTRTVMEMAPIPDKRGPDVRGVVGEGPVMLRPLGRLRVFRYEIRRWPDGEIPDLPHAVASPVPISSEPPVVHAVLDRLADVPTPVWGRDELGTGDMWNSNSVISWVLSSCGLIEAAGAPPDNGRAPGWQAGVHTRAHRSPQG